MLHIKKIFAHSEAYLEQLHSDIERESDFFPGQRKGEKVKICIRSHWLREIKILLNFFCLAIVFPLVFLYLLSFFHFSGVNWSYVHFALLLYLGEVWLYAFIEFIKSELTVIIITNQRVVSLTQSGLFHRQISEITLNRIEEVSGFTSGFFSNFFNVGKLEIQSGSMEIPLIMHYVESPNLTSRKILDLQRFSNQQRNSDFSQRVEDNLQARQGEDLAAVELKQMRGIKDTQNIEVIDEKK